MEPVIKPDIEQEKNLEIEPAMERDLVPKL